MTAPRANLREAHAHIAQHGRAMTMERLESCTSLDDCLQRIARVANRAADRCSERSVPPAPDWLLGVGLRVEAWPEHEYPSAAQLDRLAGDRPVCLWSFDHHALVVNTAAMRSVGISPDTPDPANGRIVRDGRDAPTGLMLEAAAKLVWSRIPEPSESQRREHVRAALRDLASHGFTEIHDLLSPPWLGPILAELHDAGELDARIWLYPRIEEIKAVDGAAPTWRRDTIRLAGAKLFADGTLNSRTAFMLHPYADPIPDLPRGQQMASPQQIRDAIDLTHRLGQGLAIHAIGDAAVRACLDAWESAPSSLHRPVASSLPPIRLEHAEIIDEADIPRFAKLGVVCSVQPCHLLADIEALQRGLPHRLDRVLPLRDLIDAGCRPGQLLWFGSDTPIVRPHPEDSIQAATQRRRHGMPDSAAIAPKQAITTQEARRAFT
jgi:predicted amidohydrolase YtcJ